MRLETEAYIKDLADVINCESDVKDCIVAIKRLSYGGLVVFAIRHDGKAFSHELPKPPNEVEEGIWHIVGEDGNYIIS